MCNAVTDSLSRKMAMSYSEFIDHLFDPFRNPNKEGLYIQRDDGHYTRIDVIKVSGKIIIRMDDEEMGYFEETTQRGYKCIFHQKNRTGLRQGLTPNEVMMRSICDNPLILFRNA